MFIEFFIPFLYSFKTRFKRNIKLISWCLIYIVPLTFIAYIYSGSHGIIITCINITLVYTVYEIGYIFNDVYTIKKESQPTLRLSLLERQYCESNLFFILLIRIIISTILILFLYYLDFNYIYSLIVASLILLTYIIYNSIRNIGNLFLHFILVNLRYTAVVIPFLNHSLEILIVVLLFPLINLIERASEKRFHLPFFQNCFLANKSSGRYTYYFLLSLILLLSFGLQYKLLWVSCYYFCFRFFSVFILRNSDE
ncbi:hypothetical protein AM461_03775 [Providencia rettgeri]|nr:hypothetical protein AM461_03775 [Providencia rettgeri]